MAYNTWQDYGYGASKNALDDVAQWLGFTDANYYLDTMFMEGSAIFRRAS